jgi:WD40-like Beta Propeller Repeat
MTGPRDFDRLVTAWLDERVQPRAPDDVLDGALARTSRLRRRPAWRIRERWIPMRLSLALAVIPRAVIILVCLALAAALAAAVVVASQPTALPSLVGPARNGLLAYDSAGDIWVMNPDGTGQRQLTSGPERDSSPVWSRDGTRMAFWSFPPPAAPAVVGR